MKYFLVIVAIICMAIFVGAQEEEVDFPKPIPEPIITRLDVTLIDDMNDQVIKLENSVIQVLGELHIAEDSFNYSNTFLEGDRYEMTIWIKVKK